MNDRELLTLRLRGDGNSFRMIGKTIGVSTERARQIFTRAARKRNFNRETVNLPSNAIEHLGLPARVYNALKRGGIDTIEDILNCPCGLIGVKNLGKKSIEEIKTKIREYKGE